MGLFPWFSQLYNTVPYKYITKVHTETKVYIYIYLKKQRDNIILTYL